MSTIENAPQTHELSTIEELAAEMRVPVATIRRWRYIGEGPRAIKVGRHLRWRRAEIDRWLREREGLS